MNFACFLLFKSPLSSGTVRFHRYTFSTLSKSNFALSTNSRRRTAIIQNNPRQFTLQPSLRQQQRPKVQVDREKLREQLIVSRSIRGELFGLTPRLRSNTEYHAGDGLNVSEWTLIYHNKGTVWLFIVFTIYSAMCFVFTAVGVEELAQRKKYLRKNGKPETIRDIVSRKSMMNIGFGIVLLATMSRYRRCWVVRIYEKNIRPGGQPPTPVIVESGAPPLKTTPPIRQYCIVWVNFLLRRKLYFYNNQETARAMEQHHWITNIIGNFTARKRSWAVFQHYFDDALDYYRVRGKRVVGGNFLA